MGESRNASGKTAFTVFKLSRSCHLHPLGGAGKLGGDGGYLGEK